MEKSKIEIILDVVNRIVDNNDGTIDPILNSLHNAGPYSPENTNKKIGSRWQSNNLTYSFIFLQLNNINDINGTVLGDKKKNALYQENGNFLVFKSNQYPGDSFVLNRWWDRELADLVKLFMSIDSTVMTEEEKNTLLTTPTKKNDNNIVEETGLNSGKHIEKHPLNLILYGPPGTGKTYNTVNEALSIIEGKAVEELQSEDRNDVLERYRKYIESGQIVFTTFHQSLSYEEFIEGIKPIPPINQENAAQSIEMMHYGNFDGKHPFNGTTTISGLERMTYEVRSGIFKQLCDNAKLQIVNNGSSFNNTIDFSNTRIFKLSLGKKGTTESLEIFDYCVNNNRIGLGWGNDIDFSNCNEREDFKRIDNTWGATALEIFKVWMRKGDVVLISNGLKHVKAIAQIEGEYEYDADGYMDIHQFRRVKWLYVGEDIPVKHFYDKALSQQAIYGFYQTPKEGKEDYNGSIDTTKLNEIICSKDNPKSIQPHVLIIDEINRGNVSQIFGELITLIEDDKRTTKWDETNNQYIGNPEKITVTLPYSQDDFGVPGNLYIIGTMNTADRSVEALDTALRRRFSFKEMMPKPELLESKIIGGIKLSDLLDTINKRICVLKDREHQIGHSYFMNCETEQDLKNVFKDKIVPLLQEYFYGNYAYIGLVLGDGFVKNDKFTSNPSFAKLDGYSFESDNETAYRLLTEEEWKDLIIKDALQTLMNKKNDGSAKVGTEEGDE